MFKVPEEYRFYQPGHPYHSTSDYGNNGRFRVPYRYKKDRFRLECIASDGEGWEHVSLHIPGKNHVPDWKVMSYIKNLFWSYEDTVLQIHPPESQYSNHHKTTLHLWRQCNKDFKGPPTHLIGKQIPSDTPKPKKEM